MIEFLCSTFCRPKFYFKIGPVVEQTKPPVRTDRKHVGGRRLPVMAGFQMTDNQTVPLTIQFTDKKGNPASTPAGAQPPVWTVDNPNVLTLTPAPDGMSCQVAAVGPLGEANVSVKVSDAGGNALAAGSLAFTIVSDAPSQVAITPGTPTVQP